MAEYDSAPDHTGYPQADGDILNDLLIQSQLAQADRLEKEALAEGEIPHELMPTGIPGLAAQELIPSNGVAASQPAPQAVDLPEEKDPEIPETAFLLRCPAGDVLLWPTGISFEEHFIVLFFQNPRDMHFTPRVRTNFEGQYDIPLDDEDDVVRQKLSLFYSGITFRIPEQETIAVIFHLRANANTPTGFVSRSS